MSKSIYSKLYKYIISIILILSMQIYYISSVKYINNKINLMLVFRVSGKYGASSLAEAYINTINILKNSTFLSQYFSLNIKSYITYPSYLKYSYNNNNVIWFMYDDYFSKLLLPSKTSISKNTIYGPLVSPKKWLLFPLNNTYELHWSYCISKLFAYIVQSERVKRHLIYYSTKINNIQRKYIVSHGCVISHYNINVASWNDRYFDILIYAKFADINREKELIHLTNVISFKYKIKLVRYGNHTKSSLEKYANNSKILIYFSYYDCWPSSLMEMQNYGIFPIVEQCDFIDKYGVCLKNIYNNTNDILINLKNILFEKYNSLIISKHYRKKNNCVNILKKTLFEIYKRKKHKNKI